MSGFVAISRKLFDHYLWTKRREFSEAEAWLDLIQAAQWQPCRQLVKGKLLEVDRGELLASLRYLQERWSWGSPNRVSRYLELLANDNMICIKNETVTQRITICKYDTYNTQRNTDGTQTEQARNTDGTDTEQTRNKDNNINKNNKNNKETTPIAQAGGFDFEKLARKVGRTCAKLMTEGEVGKKLSDEKKPLFLKWLGYRHEKGTDITTTVELAEVLRIWLEKDAAELDAAISKSIGAGWKVLVFEAQKTDKKQTLPNYWKPGIEAELKLTPEQTNEYYRHLISLKWYKTTEQGQPYWNRPTGNDARTGEASLAQTLNPQLSNN